MPDTPFDELAERRIRDALEAGLFRDLPGAGRPLELDDLTGVPDELRAGYLLLKSANVLPDEMELKRELVKLGDLVSACHDDGELRELARRRHAAALRLSVLMERRGRSLAWSEYLGAVAAKLGDHGGGTQR